MIQKISKIVFLSILFLAFFNLNFIFADADSRSSVRIGKSTSFFSAVKAKNKLTKKGKRKKGVKKLSRKDNSADFQNPLIISGDDICQRNSREALRTLFTRDREGFDFVVERLGKIECAVSGSAVYPWENPSLFRVGVATFNANPVWYASVLVHESCHIEQFRRSFEKNSAADVSAEEYFGEKAEQECLDVQAETLRKLQANQAEVDYLSRLSQSGYWLTKPGERWW